MEMSAPPLPANKKTVIWRGLCERCPQCGIGKLFISYLKPVQACASCAEDFSTIRADDGPAWLTMIVTGHVIVPTAIYLAMHDLMGQGMALFLLAVSTISLVLVLLPRAKGVFIGMIWWLRQKPPAGNQRYENAAKIP